MRGPHVGRRCRRHRRGRRHHHRRLSRWILERAEVRLQRTVHKTASLQNREIGRHGYLRVAFLRRRGGPLKGRVLLRGPPLPAEGRDDVTRSSRTDTQRAMVIYVYTYMYIRNHFHDHVPPR